MNTEETVMKHVLDLMAENLQKKALLLNIKTTNILIIKYGIKVIFLFVH